MEITTRPSTASFSPSESSSSGTPNTLKFSMRCTLSFRSSSFVSYLLSNFCSLLSIIAEKV